MNSNHTSLPGKPHPVSPPEHEPWWRALREHRLTAQCCANCGRLRLYPRPMCDACYSMNYDWVELSGRGAVHSWSVTHHAFHPGFKHDIPYVTVTVDLEEGVRLQAPMPGIDSAEVRIGMPVSADYDDIDPSLTLLPFRPAD